MMSKNHFWVVCDAVAFIKHYGDGAQKRALQAFEIGYGQDRPVDLIPAQETAVERLVGFESLHTDKFGDLALTFRSLPGIGKTNVTGLGFHMFTAFNHFINPYPDTDCAWSGASGYSYATSSMKGFDSLVVKGISEHLCGLVDIDNSLIIRRIEPFWKDGPEAWQTNFDRDLSQTRFAPWNVMARFYHSYLLQNHYEPLEVRGPNQSIVGLQVLGPLVHAAADACSVQHVRSTLGLGHTVWENYLKSKVYNREINANATLVTRLLSEEPFDPSPVISTGPLAGRFDAEQFICRLASRTADRLQASTNQTWSQLWNAGDKFWRNYLLGSAMGEDSQYLYNMAVAGTVHIIVKSYEDLVKQGILSPDKGLLHPEKMPTLEQIQKDMPELPMKKSGDGLPSEKVMPVPFSAPRDMLGFEPVGETRLQEHVSQASAVLGKILGGALEQSKIPRLFENIERELLEQYQRMEDKEGPGFCPLRKLEKLPLDSDLSAHFGTGTFRMPSSEECNNPRLLAQYIDMSDAHAYAAHKLQVTQLIAGLKFYQRKYAQRADVAKRIDQVQAGLEQIRGIGLHDAVSEAFDLVSPRMAQASGSVPAQERPTGSERFGHFFSAFEEWLAPLFRVPVTALATAAAVVLLVVVLLPRDVPELMVGLSSEKWERPQVTLMAPKSLAPRAVPAPDVEKKKIVAIISYKNFKKPPTQEVIDASYRAIRPTAAMERSFDIVSPAKVSEAVQNGEVPAGDLGQVLDGVAKKFGATEALVFTITAKGDKFEVAGELKDLESGQTIRVDTDREVSTENIHSTLSRRMEALLASK